MRWLLKRLVLSLTLGVLVFMVSFLSLPIYSFIQTKTMNGLRIDTDKERYTLSENVTFRIYIMNQSNSTLYFAEKRSGFCWKGPVATHKSCIFAIFDFGTGFSSAPPGDYLLETSNWPVGPDGKKDFPEGYALPGVSSVEFSLTYSTPDNASVETYATTTVLFTLI